MNKFLMPTLKKIKNKNKKEDKINKLFQRKMALKLTILQVNAKTSIVCML